MKTTEMFETYPKSTYVDRALLARVIDTVVECSQACTACADACLSENGVADLRRCIRANLDCADICDATARALWRQTGYDANVSRALLEACIAACAACMDECVQYASEYQYCRVCAEACRACEAACRVLLNMTG